MFFRQIYEKGLAHASYMVGCQKSGTVAVIDAKRDVDTYIDIARQENLRITHVVETHIHADFLCGSRELAEITGAEILLSDEGGSEWQYAFEHTGLREGSHFMVGNIRFDVWHTPGHTPEHISFLVTDTPASSVPVMMFTGDFVFVGDVGRPDLLERAAGYTGTMEDGARSMYASLARFRALPDHIQIHPAHGAGSACGKSLGDVPHSTVGYEKLVNWALQIHDEELFVKTLLEGQPEPPRYFAMMKHLNKSLRPLVCAVPEPPLLDTARFLALRESGAQIIDTRDKSVVTRAAVPGSLWIADGNAFSTWAGWMVDYDKDIVIIGAKTHMAEICRRLMRIGLDAIVGFADASHVAEYWPQDAASAAPMTHIPWLSVAQLRELRSDATDNGGADIYVLDVRKATEYADGHVPGARHIHAGYLREHLDELPRDRDIAVMCAAGARSTIACSVLAREGFTNLFNVTGGFDAWNAAGYEKRTGSEP